MIWHEKFSSHHGALKIRKLNFKNLKLLVGTHLIHYDYFKIIIRDKILDPCENWND